jgi:hypothetical protein
MMSMEVFLSPHAAELTGTVRSETGDIVRDATVSLWSTTPQISNSIRVTTTHSGGTFRFGNLPDGDYRILAWEEIDPGLANNWELCKFFENRSASIQLDKDGRTDVQLHLILKNDIEVAKSRLP